MKNLFSRFVTLFGLGSLFATQGQSAIVYTSTSFNLTLSSAWDIDADGTSETTFEVGGYSLNRDNIDFIRPDPVKSGLLGHFLPLQDLVRDFSIRAALGNYAWAGAGRGQIGNSSTYQEQFGGLSYDTSSYIGFRFDGDRATSGRQNLYGWARATFNSHNDWNIHEWAYEDVIGEAIAVGATGVIPEPTSASLGLLALGAVGLRRWRKGTA